MLLPAARATGSYGKFAHQSGEKAAQAAGRDIGCCAGDPWLKQNWLM